MTKIIAEIGINHNGQYSYARKLIDLAISAGVDIIKFQTFVPEKVVIKKLGLAPYQKRNVIKNKLVTMLDMIKKYHLTFSKQKKIYYYCKKKKIEFISSPFDVKSSEFLLSKLKLKKIKIASGEITNYPLLEHISGFDVEIILSTGMANLLEIKDAIRILTKGKIKKENICILHCHTEYPTSLMDCNLNSILFLKNSLKMNVGFSDHSETNEAAFLSVALGVKYIEKHITLKKTMEGPDHKSSLDKFGLIDLVKKVNLAKKILGFYEKKPTEKELKNLIYARKSIVASRKIEKGEILSVQNITTKRPLLGHSASKWKSFIGVKASRKYKKDDFIK
jgi:N,N'-diacetyllegionaminate synthase